MEEKLLREAAEEAGFAAIELMTEPVAAARAWLSEAGSKAEDVVVFDAGGDSLGWAYLARKEEDFEVVKDCPPDGDRHAGGQDIDEELFNLLRDAVGADAEAEALLVENKIHYVGQLRERKQKLRASTAPKPIRVGSHQVELSEARIREIIAERFIDQARMGLGTYLEKVKAFTGRRPPVLLVGGSSRVEGLAAALKQGLDCQILHWERSEYATALGAVVPSFRTPGDNTVPALLRKAEQGEVGAQFELGARYALGLGITQDYGKAVAWYRKAAEQGHAGAQCCLGEAYLNGRGWPKDDRQAVPWFRKAAEQGHAGAQFCLGNAYAEGRGLPRDDRQAEPWFRKAAEQGNTEAQLFLGFIYTSGDGAVPLDDRQGVAWFRKAAEQGHAGAQAALGYMHADGRGVPRDDAQAAVWLRKAAEQGWTLFRRS